MKAESAILILGNQLFPLAYYRSLESSKVVMAEDSGLCTHYKYHKHKIILFLSAMRKFAQELENDGFKVSYYPATHKLFDKGFDSKLLDFLKKNKSVKTLHCYEIEDKFFENYIFNFCEK
ncbi:MAG: cryptochrome/photolyase family protein, partial [Deltaproteobacteria bacterium]